LYWESFSQRREEGIRKKWFGCKFFQVRKGHQRWLFRLIVCLNFEQFYQPPFGANNEVFSPQRARGHNGFAEVFDFLLLTFDFLIYLCTPFKI
jgi:hypothetical protein